MAIVEKDTTDELLEQLGRKVRALRAGRGMTRKMLAADSAVSERYLAQLEQGQGNISINLLQRVAKALRTDAGELLAPGRPVQRRSVRRGYRLLRGGSEGGRHAVRRRG